MRIATLWLLAAAVAGKTACPDDPLCKVCSTSVISGERECTACQNAFFHFGARECRAPRDYLPNCITYDSNVPSKCRDCYYGYFANAAGQCTECPENCWRCADERTCLSCFLERVPVEGDCRSKDGPKCDQKKIKNCEFCSAAQTCFKCRYGYSLDEKGECVPSTPNCLEVEEGQCKQCWNLYFLTADSKCAVINKNTAAWYGFMLLAFLSLAAFGHVFFRREHGTRRRMTEESYVSILSNFK